MIREFLSQIDFNQLARFAGEIVNVVLHGLIITIVAAIPVIIIFSIIYGVEKIKGKQND